MNHTGSQQIKEMKVGRRTGVILPPTSTFISSDELENPGQLFDAAAIVEESPNASVDGSIEKGNDASTALADFAEAEAKKPKVTVRFSLGEDVVEEFEPSIMKAITAHHPVRRLINRNNRESIDTMDLSTVSTARSVASLKKGVDEGEVEASRQSSEEMEVAAVVAAAQKHGELQKPVVLSASPIIAEAPDISFDDDDSIPSPPPESPRRDDFEEELHTRPGDDNDVEFPNTVDDDDNNKDGAGFDMRDDSNDDADDDDNKDDEPDSNNVDMNEPRRRKEKRMEKLAEKKRSHSTKKGKKKKNDQSNKSDSDGDDAVKPKSKPKKKINPFSTHFAPKGVPGPRTYTQIPLSDLKADTPEDTQARRSKRVRLSPLEFWRGEKPTFGGNDFGDEFDGVKNMPVVVGIAKPDPTPYKKRKVVPVVSNPKKKSVGQRQGGNVAGPVVIAADEPFDSTSLRHEFHISDGRLARLWDEHIQEVRVIKVVSYVASAKATDLPMSKTRTKSEGKVVGKAAQSFQMSNEENPAFPGYLAGHLLLPPKAIKDPESTGTCAQLFTVVRGQAKSIEVAYGNPERDGKDWDAKNAERFLLAPGDNFMIPPGNTYRLRNHSAMTESLLSWTIIRPNPILLLNDED